MMSRHIVIINMLHVLRIIFNNEEFNNNVWSRVVGTWRIARAPHCHASHVVRRIDAHIAQGYALHALSYISALWTYHTHCHLCPTRYSFSLESNEAFRALPKDATLKQCPNIERGETWNFLKLRAVTIVPRDITHCYKWCIHIATFDRRLTTS